MSLRPCPFCGDLPYFGSRQQGNYVGAPAVAVLMCCGIDINATSEQLWNTRAKVTRLIINVPENGEGYVCESSTS